ncbi:MxiM family type III secretion system pilotin, partial [Shigella flexneri]|uniref:MxiM family type III secretion system pilotin n=1 Tax=Shigella flexneri TaxID=623 RepID=UPI0006402A1A
FMGNFNVKEVDGCFMDAQKIAIDKLFSMLKDGVVLKGNKINDTILIEKDGEVKLKLIRGSRHQVARILWRHASSCN